MTSFKWWLVFSFSLTSVLETDGKTRSESKPYVCGTFGSGVVQPFRGTLYHVRSNCPFTLTQFTHNRVECGISVRRGPNGLLDHVEITINKIKTVLHNGTVQVEATKSVALPYDHTYQHIFPYGIYTQLRSTLIPLSVLWHNVPGGIDTLWIKVELPQSTEVKGLCGNLHALTNIKENIFESVLQDESCVIQDSISTVNAVCRTFFSYTLDCLKAMTPAFIQVCEENICNFEQSPSVSCSFFKEVARLCGSRSHIWGVWRKITHCEEPKCAGDLFYAEEGQAFVPSCSNPEIDNNEVVSSCVCPNGQVLNDHEEGSRCVSVSSCSCLYGDILYEAGATRSSKRESCVCAGGHWNCTPFDLPPVCVLEGPFISTFDGKQYSVCDDCQFVAAQGPDWKIIVEYAEGVTIKSVHLHLFEEKYLFADNAVTFGATTISDLHASEHALVFWQSTMFVQVYTTFGLKLQVQMSPEIQLYISPPSISNHTLSGLCGNNNGDTTDDFRTSSGIIESSAQVFALSWSVGQCNIIQPPPTCTRTEYEMYAEEQCSVLINPTGMFAACHEHIPTDYYLETCFQRTCSCVSQPQQCLCLALSSYVKACTSLGVEVGDWRTATNCAVDCPGNQEFSYNAVGCNSTCQFLSGLDPRCLKEETPVEGCACPKGTHRTVDHTCSPKAQCECHYNGGTTPPGPAVIDGLQCICEDGQLRCSDNCGCTNGKVCVHCSEFNGVRLQKTCGRLSKPSSSACENGCYCPFDEYENHHGVCVPLENCTCSYSGNVYAAGDSIRSDCKTCVCSEGQWSCTEEHCPGKCQVYGNGHYQTFDSKWFRFDGHCQYTLVEDACGVRVGTFSISAESVPCCDEALTCSRSIILDVKGYFSLTLSDMTVTEHLHSPSSRPLYMVRTVGLYLIVSVPWKGITLIWDKHTWITVELLPQWRSAVCGLCGNFDSSEMNDLQIKDSSVALSPMTFGNSWKVPSPPCSDVIEEIFPCERHSYCASWAQRRCRIITGDSFRTCHLKVNPEPYYQACVQESCSCELEGRFLGFCTAVAAYAEACSAWDICVDWRTPDLCPVYCDYYNEQDECVWHYEACGQLLTCGREKPFPHKLEGCYPKCPEKQPYYDENTGKCTALKMCTCDFHGTVMAPQEEVVIDSEICFCQNGIIQCPPGSTTTPTVSTTNSTTSTTTESTSTATTAPTTTSASTTPLTTTPEPTTTPTTTAASTTTSPPTTVPSTTSATPSTNASTTVSISTTTFVPSTTTSETTVRSTTGSTTPVCECVNLMTEQKWQCGETWTENCNQVTCTDHGLQLAPVQCATSPPPHCPRGLAVNVSDGCCEQPTCDCRCELYGDPHYVSFQGVLFDFLEDCTYVLAEERRPLYNLTIAVDNFFCVPGLNGSCVKGVIVKYKGNTAELNINQELFAIQVSLNNVLIQTPWEGSGMRFESTGFITTLFLPEIRSFVSLTPSFSLIVSLAMETFLNNTQGQCGVCGGDSCVRRGGQVESDTCCEKTAHDWIYDDPRKPQCVPAPKDLPCPITPEPPRHCPSPVCDLLHHRVFAECRKSVDLSQILQNCEFDACGDSPPCSSVEKAANECKKFGFLIEWRTLADGSCDVPCPKGLVYKEYSYRMDDFCLGGVRQTGELAVGFDAGCFCPNDQIRESRHSDFCVDTCRFCKGPLGEPKVAGEVWQSNCHICSCNNQTMSEDCTKIIPRLAPLCDPDQILVNRCCGLQECVEKTCSYNGHVYKVGETWQDVAEPCRSFSCSVEGIQTETKVCPAQDCPEEHKVWDEPRCCSTCGICAPVLARMNVTVEQCFAELQIPVCEGLCHSHHSLEKHGVILSSRLGLSSVAVKSAQLRKGSREPTETLEVVQSSSCCRESHSEQRPVTLRCLDQTSRTLLYTHITHCECSPCGDQSFSHAP